MSAVARRDGVTTDALGGVVPGTVFEPSTLEEAAESLREGAREGLRAGFLGGGTVRQLGDPPEALDTGVSTRRLARLVEHAPHDQVVTVEAGLTLAALQAALAPQRQRLALDPPNPERATLGGLVATNDFGPLRTRYGSLRDLVIGATMVRADGVVASGGGKVVKNVAGFDLPRLLVGSLGTLGLVARVTLRLHPLPEASETLYLPGLAAAQLRDLVRVVRELRLEPDAFVALGTGDVSDAAIRFEGFRASVVQQHKALLSRALRMGIDGTVLGPDQARGLWAQHDALRSTPPIRLKVAARPSALERTLSSALSPLLATLASPALVWYPPLGLGFVTGEPGGGDVASAVRAARAAVETEGGALTVLAADTSLRAAVGTWGTPPASVALMRSLKQKLDPDRRLAPGRFVGGI